MFPLFFSLLFSNLAGHFFVFVFVIAEASNYNSFSSLPSAKHIFCLIYSFTLSCLMVIHNASLLLNWIHTNAFSIFGHLHALCRCLFTQISKYESQTNRVRVSIECAGAISENHQSFILFNRSSCFVIRRSYWYVC